MLTDLEKQTMRDALDAIKRGLPGYSSRRSQLEMIAAVAETLASAVDDPDAVRDGSNMLVCEAPTGTGKTASGLLAGLVMAKSRGKHLIYSSSTIALQEQLARKDIPLFQSIMPFEFTAAVAKGRSRYVCAAKLADATGDGVQLCIDTGDGKDERGDGTEHDDLLTLIKMAQDYANGSWSGDKDDLTFAVTNEAWDRITTDRQGCSGNKCPQFATCAFYAARQRIKEADVIVANHDLVLSALDMPAGSVLPDPAESLIIFDEAHSLGHKGVEHFAQKHALRAAQEWVRQIADVVSDVVYGLRLDAGLHKEAEQQASHLAGYLEDLYQAILSTRAFEEKAARRFKDGVMPRWGSEIGANILSSAKGLTSTTAEVRKVMLEAAEREPELLRKLMSGLGFYLGKLENLVNTWELLLRADPDGFAPTARWVEKYASSADANDFMVCASPITAANRLRALLWNRVSAVVLTSATLTSCCSFHLFLEQTGLDRYRKTRLLQLPSPFDYANRAVLSIPRMNADPKNHRAHTQEIVMQMPRLATSRGTLVLFASGKQMREVHSRLPAEFTKLVLMQGALPKMEIIARHKVIIDAGGTSVIFGLQSFAEGVDLPNEYCTHVIIAKLPFSVPDSPLQEARCEWVEKQGRSPFVELAVPEVGVRLAQGVGRLLRTDDDYGMVTVLDRRLAASAWGRMLIRGLPPFRLEIGKRVS
jgi:ATP-dependent DNA helicase DinG